MKNFAKDRGIPTLVFLTKIDAYDPDLLVEDLTKAFKSKRIMDLMPEVATLAGVGGTKDVFPVKSFSHEYEPNYEVGILLFRALEHALYAATDYLEAVGTEATIIEPQTPTQVRATASWAAEDAEEMSLVKGQLYIVESPDEDGWLKGKSASGSACGYFPAMAAEAKYRQDMV
ncbi:hypothetical protein WJX72_012472 [[Myrmecia] bisecta]|uniref:SH3 domain-containing protein n=1 Tax=[Myrmecia] bisecta TaxID=41462 RepID=A0AAW1Q4Z7_9CHLO